MCYIWICTSSSAAGRRAEPDGIYSRIVQGELFGAGLCPKRVRGSVSMAQGPGLWHQSVLMSGPRRRSRV